jgi:hypothetical protein
VAHEPDAAAQRFFASLDAREAAVRPTVAEPLRSEGYEVYPTGGGCLAWRRNVGEAEYVLITWFDSVDGDPEAGEWLVGRYHEDGGWINLDQLFTLREAMEVARKLPSARRADGSIIEEIFDTLEAALQGVEAPSIQTESFDVGAGRLIVAVHRESSGELVVEITTDALAGGDHGPHDTPRMRLYVNGEQVWSPRAGMDAVWPIHLGLDSFPDAAAIERGMLSNLSDEWHATAVDAEGRSCDTHLKVSVVRRTGSRTSALGKYRDVLGSSDAFAERKQDEIDVEDRRSQ